MAPCRIYIRCMRRTHNLELQNSGSVCSLVLILNPTFLELGRVVVLLMYIPGEV